MTYQTLLPSNSTPLELQAAEALAQIQRVPIPLRTLYNPDKCPLPLLPYLAWSFSVDRWDSQWPESAKRSAIRSAYYIHSRKGTLGSLRRVVEPLGFAIEVVEWWQTIPLGPRATFALNISVSGTGITEQMYQELTWLIDDAKPLTRHLTGLDIILETRVESYAVIATDDGDEIDVYPWINPDIDVFIQSYGGASIYTLDEMDVYLHG
ncbi:MULTISPECIES: phage tail protein I [Pseudomonas]|uniref:phage tail protein I n=1 Tax=Pseudomonas TaxID=286 RepID=UPI000876F425|nr:MULTISPECIES: phage tail protein I [Pseudomonas]SCZ38201.1 phage tail protein, P2 protein I family [Pseudomonas sp. NFIX46]SDB46529.1 phage tail protein, P2 protein I family [Pseudomonas putida]SFQ91837.1 phage tail protein, P2 protein I family [Pseudomonas sp. NFIX49]